MNQKRDKQPLEREMFSFIRCQKTAPKTEQTQDLPMKRTIPITVALMIPKNPNKFTAQDVVTGV